jgi:hypothetical protein
MAQLKLKEILEDQMARRNIPADPFTASPN